MNTNNNTQQYNLNNQAYFDEATHTYWATEADFLRAQSEYASQGGQGVDFATFAKAHRDSIISTTQVLGNHYEYDESDIELAKAWIAKAGRQGLIDASLALANEESIWAAVAELGLLATSTGNSTHEVLQNYIAAHAAGDTSGVDLSVNRFTKYFGSVLKMPNHQLAHLIKNVVEVLPCEQAVAYVEEGTTLFTGMWDGLWRLANGSVALIDIKTGAQVTGTKLEKVEHQLNAYNNLVYQALGIDVDLHICIELSDIETMKGSAFSLNAKVHTFSPDPLSFLELLD